jgi:hypothetical protein
MSVFTFLWRLNRAASLTLPPVRSKARVIALCRMPCRPGPDADGVAELPDDPVDGMAGQAAAAVGSIERDEERSVWLRDRGGEPGSERGSRRQGTGEPLFLQPPLAEDRHGSTFGAEVGNVDAHNFPPTKCQIVERSEDRPVSARARIIAGDLGEQEADAVATRPFGVAVRFSSWALHLERPADLTDFTSQTHERTKCS